VLFDSVINKFNEVNERLKKNNSLVFSPDFENGIAKIISGSEQTLTDGEKEATSIFLTEEKEDENSAEDEDFAFKMLEKERKNNEVKSAYLDVTWIPPTSNVVERLFSASRQVLLH
jgi:hypothetical protein